MTEKQYTTGTVAALLGVTQPTVVRWCDTGEIINTVTDSGIRLIPESEIIRLQNAELDELELRALPAIRKRIVGL